MLRKSAHNLGLLKMCKPLIYLLFTPHLKKKIQNVVLTDNIAVVLGPPPSLVSKNMSKLVGGLISKLLNFCI